MDGSRGGIPLPGGRFELLVNGRSVAYTAERLAGRGPFLDDGTQREPDGLFEVRVKTEGLLKGDSVTGRLVGIGMKGDGGGERTANMVGTKGGFTYGLGTIDLNFEPPEWRWLDTAPVDGGFEVRLAEDPPKGAAFPTLREIPFLVAWTAGEDGGAYDVVSFCTC